MEGYYRQEEQNYKQRSRMEAIIPMRKAMRFGDRR